MWWLMNLEKNSLLLVFMRKWGGVGAECFKKVDPFIDMKEKYVKEWIILLKNVIFEQVIRK